MLTAKLEIPSDILEQSTEDKIIAICTAKGFKYHISKNCVTIRTRSLSGWLVWLEEGKKPKLYHENYRRLHGAKRAKASVLSNYHIHKLEDMSIENILEYIESHDYGKHNIYKLVPNCGKCEAH